MTKFPTLLSPVKLGALNLPNRVAMAPMTRGRAGPTYTANSVMGEYYAQRASAGLLIAEGAQISLQARGWYGAPEIYTPEHAAGWREVTSRVHDAGGRIFVQLWHSGRAGHSNFRAAHPDFPGERAAAVSPSALRRPSTSGKQTHTAVAGDVDVETPRALTTDEVRGLADDFRCAAQTAKDAGFDGVEIHAANGYLLDTFLQSCSNERTDEYGGSRENRFRVLDEVVRAVVPVFGAGRVGVRLSPNGSFNGMGYAGIRDDFLYYAGRLSAHGLAYLHLMIGTGFGFHGFGEPLTMADFRAVYDGAMIANVGYSAESAEAELRSGNADVVAFGRPFLANPDLVERFRVGAALAPMADKATWYSEAGNDHGAKGYTTYKPMK